MESDWCFVSHGASEHEGHDAWECILCGAVFPTYAEAARCEIRDLATEVARRAAEASAT